MSERLLVFVRHPEIGRVKTRLAREVGKRRALFVYKSLLRSTLVLARVQAAMGRSVEVWVAPGRRLQAFQSRWGQGLSCLAQTAGDLGSRLRVAFDRSLKQGICRTVVIGSDCPDLTGDHLKDAFHALRKFPAVLGPAADGGYYLLGLSQPIPEILTRISWGTERVLETTLTRLRQKGMRWRLLETLHDVDRKEDLYETIQVVGQGGGE